MGPTALLQTLSSAAPHESSHRHMCTHGHGCVQYNFNYKNRQPALETAVYQPLSYNMELLVIFLPP